MSGINEARRTSFGSVAVQYHRARPSYPQALVQDVIEYAGARPGSPALEIGAGTGKATALFAAYGLKITAIEPSAQMAAVADAQGLPAGTRFLIERLEDAVLEPSHFQLAFSGQAWHWVEAITGERMLARSLVSGGALACFWNRIDWSRCACRDALLAAYASVGWEAQGLMNPGQAPPEFFESGWRARIDQVDGLVNPEQRIYEWTETYTTAEYIALLGTHSDHVTLAEEQRIRLFGAVAGVIEEAGGELEIVYSTQLCLARAV